jgi:hypothetical protein
MNRIWPFCRVAGALLMVAVFVAACQSAPQRERKPSADWSRGVLVGRYAKGSIGIAVEDAGARVHLVWPSDIGEGGYFRYVRLDTQANLAAAKDLELPGLLRAPRLVLAEAGGLHFFWASRAPGEKAWTIWHMMLDPEGNPASPVVQISAPGVNVGDYAVASDHQGGALVAWDNGSFGNINLQSIDRAGLPASESIALELKGKSPSLSVSADGELALAWLGESGFSYAYTPLEALSIKEPTQIVDLVMGTGQSLVGPFLGTAGDWAYVFWSVLNQSGLEAGTGYTAYAAFLLSAPEKQGATRLWISPEQEQPYAPYQGVFSIAQLVPPVREAWASSDYILRPSVMQGNPAGELAVAVALNQQMRLDQHLQVAVAVFKEGQFEGYTLGTKTEGISDNPVLFVDSANQLHLAWREGAAGNGIFYATTQPQAIAALDRLNIGDLVNAIFQGGLESIVSVALLPVIGFGWLLPGMLIVGIVKLLRDQDNLTDWRFWVPLGIAIMAFYAAKLATLPTITTYVPFSAWLDLPSRFDMYLRLAVPALIFVISALVAQRVCQRHSQSAVLFYIAFTLVDALLTLAVYGVNFLGVY